MRHFKALCYVCQIAQLGHTSQLRSNRDCRDISPTQRKILPSSTFNPEDDSARGTPASFAFVKLKVKYLAEYFTQPRGWNEVTKEPELRRKDRNECKSNTPKANIFRIPSLF